MENKENENATVIEAEAAEKKPKVKKKMVREFFSDFRKFIAKGNILNLAVAVVIGGAFGLIVSGFVSDIIMPLLRLIPGQEGMAGLQTVLKPGAEGVEPVILDWGDFIQKIINFLIVAFVLFIVIRLMVNAEKGIVNARKKRHKKRLDAKKTDAEKLEEETEAEPKKIETTEEILKDIRALLLKLSGVSDSALPTEQDAEADAVVN